MALTCARCGAQNPDGNQFCQACGTPLTPVAAGAPSPAPAVASPALAFASPPPTPVGYASPYYSPTGAAPQAPIHRMSWILIISAVVALIVLMAGCGTAIALLGRAGQTNGSGIASQVPSPSPGVSPSPIASPTSISGATASNDGETIPVPTGWVVDSKDSESITLTDPSGAGVITVASGPSNPRETAQQQKDGVDKYFSSKYPDTKNCPNSQTTTGNLDGAPGIFWEICFTLVSGAQSFPAAGSLFVGANADGSVFYGVILLTHRDNMPSFINEAAPILKNIQWKLK